mmetsp:Transcript_50302/g.90391  ORF Transcript_50302/g.90391 Transcript_50302/m.90391 type:complete len:134 (+) Transcript_50302:991-1392(+)
MKGACTAIRDLHLELAQCANALYSVEGADSKKRFQTFMFEMRFVARNKKFTLGGLTQLEFTAEMVFKCEADCNSPVPCEHCEAWQRVKAPNARQNENAPGNWINCFMPSASDLSADDSLLDKLEEVALRAHER